jgi:hypothetical protein
MHPPGLVASQVHQTIATHRTRDLLPQKMSKPGTKMIMSTIVFFLLPGRANTVLNYPGKYAEISTTGTGIHFRLYVCPHLKFAAPSWTPWLTGDKETLENVQEKAVKMVAGLPTG